MKTPWEARVGLLLHDSRYFSWAFKPVDGPTYGGQPRLDWLACDRLGRFWMVEVKSLARNRRSINLMIDVSPGQRRALSDVADSALGVALLAVGQGTLLHLFDWRVLAWHYLSPNHPEPTPLVPLERAFLTLAWTGPASWIAHHPHDAVLAACAEGRRAIGQTPTPVAR